MPKEVMNTMKNINSAQPVRNEELQHAPNRPSFVFLSFGRVGAVLGFFRCFDSPCVRQHVPNSTSLVFGVNTSILVHNFLG